MKNLKQLLSNPQNPTVDGGSKLYFYPIGTTPMKDLLQEMQPDGQDVDFLLLGADEVGHLLKTVSEIHNKSMQPKELSFWLNHEDTWVLARNALLLEIIAIIDPSIEDDMLFLWSVWYNLVISRTHWGRLTSILTRLCQFPFKPVSRVEFGSPCMLKGARKIWQHWNSDCKMEVASYKERRRECVRTHNERVETWAKGEPWRIEEICTRISFQKLTNAIEKGDLEHGDTFWNEIEFWVHNGSTKHAKMYEQCVNTTFLRPSSEEWVFHCILGPYHSYVPALRDNMELYGSLTGACLEILKKLVDCFQNSKIPLQITFYTSEALTLCSTNLPKDKRFDVIHANLIDRVDLLNLLVCCGPRLKRQTSMLHTGSGYWTYTASNFKDFIELSIPCDPLLMPTILGVQLAEHLDLGTRVPVSLAQRMSGVLGVETCMWARALNTDITPLQLSDSTEIFLMIKNLMKQCFVVDLGGTEEPELSTPVTMMKLILNTQDRFVDAGKLVEFVTASLPTMDTSSGVCRPHQFTWEAMKQAFKITKNTGFSLLHVKLRLQLSPTMGDIQGTCSVQLVILEEILDIPFFSEKVPITSPHLYLMGKAGIVPQGGKCCRAVHIINNFHIRRESGSLFVHFVLRKEDWNSIPAQSVVMVFTRKGLFPYSLPQTKQSASVQPVDEGEIETLFSSCNQERMRKPAVSDIKIASVIEHTDEYKVEMFMAKQQQIVSFDTKFNPEAFPCNMQIEVQSDNGGAKKCIAVNFSCAVLSGKTKIRVSKRKGTISCTVPKDPIGTIGPARIPLEIINIGQIEPLNNVQEWHTVLKEMFLRPGEWFSKEVWSAHSSDPFLHLRRTVCALWEFARESPERKHCQVVSLDGMEGSMEECNHAQAKHRKSFMDLVRTGCYIYQGLPLMTLCWVDYEVTDQLIQSSELTTKEVAKFQREACGPYGRFYIGTDVEDRNLLRKLLETNSYRMEQSTKQRDRLWKRNTFIQLYFCREDMKLNELLSDMPSSPDSEKASENQQTCSYCDKSAGSDQQKCRHCKDVTYCSEICQAKHWPVHKKFCIKVKASDLTQDDQLAQDGERCSACNKQGRNLKRCKRCREALYCDKVCQSHHWAIHKTTCTTKTVSGKSHGVVEDITPKCMFCKKYGPNLRKCAGCKNVQYCDAICQAEHWPFHQAECRPDQSGTERSSGIVHGSKRKCAFCSKSGSNLRKCAGCRVALYCDATCQRSHWTTHREQCGSELGTETGVATGLENKMEGLDLGDTGGQGGSQSCSFCGKSGYNLKKCTKCELAVYCDTVCQSRHSPVHKRDCRPESDENSKQGDELFQEKTPTCAACSKNGYNLYKCAGCKVAVYCSRFCQTYHWSVHQIYCGLQHTASQ